MTVNIRKDIFSQLQDIPGTHATHKGATAILWERWIHTQAMRLGLKAEDLYGSISIDISNADKITQELGKEIDLPDPLKQNPNLLSLLNNQEILDHLEAKVSGKPSFKANERAMLQNWMEQNKLVDQQGNPQTFYHGSFGDIESFKKNEQSKFSRLGQGFYFSSSPQDASDNYASPDSPELQAKAQAIEMSLRTSSMPIENISYSDIKESLSEEGGAVYPVYLRMNSPFVISKDVPYHHGKHEKAIQFGAIASAIVIDHKGDMELAQRLINKLNAATTTLDAVNVISEFARYHQLDGLPLHIIQRSGYDGVIDKSAGDLWHTPNNAEHFIVFEPNQIKSAIGNVGSYNNTSHNILYQNPPSYDSVLFQFGGVNAQRANVTQLQIARSLHEKGAPMEAIRQHTGWHKFVDDKWRFEFSDAQAMLRRDSFKGTLQHFDRRARELHGPKALFANLPPRDKNYISTNFAPSLVFQGKIDEALDHPKLFKYYPQLKDISADIQIHPDIKRTSANLTMGAPDEWKITCVAPNAKAALEAIIHETQHAIQEVERFASGGTADNYANTNPETQQFYLQQLKDLQAVVDLSKLRQVPYAEAAEKLGTLINASAALTVKQSTEAQINDYIHKLECESRSPRNRYLHLAGEYEARQTQNRQHLSSEERMNTPIDAFEPIDLNKLEVTYTQRDVPNQADFSMEGPKGALIRNPLESKFLMLLSDNHNPSTLIHESCHAFLDIFVEQAKQPEAPQCIKDDYLAICRFLEADPSQPFNRDQNEKWAEVCEKYFLEGDSFEDAPQIFNRLNEAMKESYASSAEIDVEVSPEIKNVLDNMFDFNDTFADLDFAEISRHIDSGSAQKNTGLNH